MHPSLRYLLVLPQLLLLPSLCLFAVNIKSPSASPTLQQLTQRSGYIFAGTVLTVERVQPKAQNEVATIRVAFRVDQAIRGVSAKQTLTIREWAGLWDSGERYRPGEQVLLFLYPSSKLGLTSPVNGSLGHFKLDRNGRILLNAERLAALQIGTPVPNPSGAKKVSISGRDFARAIRRAGE